MDTFQPTVDFVSVKTDGTISLIERILILLGGKSKEAPPAYGWFHLLSIFLIILVCVLVFLFARNISEKKLNLILGITAGALLLLEVYKQLTYSYHASSDTWDYQWYIFPFQFCATPMYTMLIAAFLKKGKLKTALCSYLATFGLFGGLVVILYPNDIFTRTIGVNIHGLVHHAAMVAIGIIMYATGRAKLSHKTILYALPVFGVFITLAMIGNILYGELLFPITGETCNLFYISPYFPCTLPILGDFIYGKAPYIVFFIIYAAGFTVAGYMMSLIAMGCQKLFTSIEKKIRLQKEQEQTNDI